MGLVRENATSFFMQRILFLQLSHSPWLHSKDLHSNSHCESSGGVFATKGPLTKFLNPSNGLAIPTSSQRNVALIDTTILLVSRTAALRSCTRHTVEST